MAVHNQWNHAVPIVDPKTGRASEEFLRWLSDNTGTISDIDGDVSGLTSDQAALASALGALTINDMGDVDTASTPPADGDNLHWDGASSLWIPAAPSGGGGGGGWTVIQEKICVGTEANIDFTAIPATYRHLKLICMGRTTQPTIGNNLRMRLNGDLTAANYESEQVQGAGGGASGASFSGAGSYTATLGTFPGSTSLANAAGLAEVLIPFYARTTFFKTWRSVSGQADYPLVKVLTGLWKNTAAINRIFIDLEEGAPTFVAGSVFTLYGIS